MEAKPEHPAALDIIVVGAGISGLATAISCLLSGHRVTIFEAAKELGEVGAGLQITPNASWILKEWGVPDSLWKLAAEPTCLSVHRYSDGKILAMEKDFGKKIRSKYRAPFVALHRADLHKALYERSHQLGVEIQLGQKVVQIDFEQTMIVTESGLTAKADLVVAADGLWSQCRQCFLGVKEPPLPTGDLAYRILLHLDDIDDPQLREWVSKPAVHFWIGPEAHAVGYSLRAGNMYNIVLLVPDDLPEGVKRQTASVDEMRALFKGWDPILGRFLDMVKKVDKWKLMHRSELQNWVNDESNLVFVQGANSAIEDGAVLGRLLGKIYSKEQLPSALKMYERLRKSRGEAIVKEAFKQRDVFHMKDGPEQQARDELFLSQLGKEIQAPFPSRWTCPNVQRWLYGYNVNKELQEATKRGLSKL
ncbi:hypothetical protein MRS44_015127 [Fusarium solani]|uniref:uncharacterized protein n=1 Tax=Fusarium solani TaxID=169388 RepID=UPI0032C477D4|nr:hypothetical protein MRS44_015127 [Fusarium solani]